MASENEDPRWLMDGPHVDVVPLEEWTKNGDKLDNVLTVMDPAEWQIRGKGYLEDKKKVAAGEPAYRILGVRIVAYESGIKHITRRLRSLRELVERHPDKEFLIVNRMLPTTPWMNTVSYFVRDGPGGDKVFEDLLTSYMEGKDEARDLKLKYIPKIPNASWVLRGAVAALGGFRPVIMGKGYLDQFHYRGPNYYEVDVDVGASRVARGIMGVIVPQQKKLVIDEAFLIEGQSAGELPERLLGCYHGVRFDLPALSITVTPEMLMSEDEAGVAPAGAADGADGADGAEATPAQKTGRASQEAAAKKANTSAPKKPAAQASGADATSGHADGVAEATDAMRGASVSSAPTSDDDDEFHDAEDS